MKKKKRKGGEIKRIEIAYRIAYKLSFEEREDIYPRLLATIEEGSFHRS